MKTFSAYAFWWWLLCFGGFTTIYGYFNTWDDVIASRWLLAFAAGLVILMILKIKRVLK